MNQRTKDILKFVEKFRVVSRDDIVDVFFSKLKQPITGANTVLKRLVTSGHLKVNKTVQPYLYTSFDSKIGGLSKTNHFNAILNFYKQLKIYKEPEMFEIEYNLGKNCPTADIYVVWNDIPFLVEIQLTYYSKPKIEEKMDKYQRLYKVGNLSKIHGHFPYVWIISDKPYPLDDRPFMILQSKDVHEYVLHYMKGTLVELLSGHAQLKVVNS